VANQGTDIVYSTATHSLGAEVENLTLLGSSAIDGSGNSLNNLIMGNSGANVLMGGAGNDTLTGGLGNDTYGLSLGSAQDVINDIDSTANNNDKLSLGAGVAKEQVWLTRVGQNLDISIIGTTDKVTISNWYAGSANRVETLQTQSGSVLSANQVQNLVNAMAGFSAPSVGTTTLDSGTYASVLSVIAANWS
jgi:Ca2+-binding RTX toxin-like protein